MFTALAINFYNSVETFTDDGFEGIAGQEDVQFDFRFTSDISLSPQLLMNSLVLGLRILRIIMENHTLISDLRRCKTC